MTRVSPLREEAGFSLIELLVVMVILGTLAALTLPLLFEPRVRGQDAEAKTNSRNMVTQLEACLGTYPGYDDPACSPPADTGLPVGSGPGQVEIVASGTGARTFEVLGHSRSGHEFYIRKINTGEIQRTCVTPNSNDRGGCRSGSW